jgi:enoyl-CoA hydratase/carnithine racemase
MSKQELTQLSFEGEVATLWFNRPEKRNAITFDTWRTLPSLVQQAVDGEARVLVIRGRGGHFCAGADISGVGRRLVDAHDPEGYRAANTAAEQALCDAPLVTIAAVEGNCIGGGCQIATSCDLRLSSTDAQYGITPAKLGLSYPAASLERTAGLIGIGQTKRLLLTADLIDAREAHRIGLVDLLVSPEEFEQSLADLVSTLTSRSLLTQLAASEMLNELSARGSISSESSIRWEALALSAPDIDEGLAAFAERRAPDFRWKP